MINEKELEAYRQELIEITNIENSGTKQRTRLDELRKKIGAGLPKVHNFKDHAETSERIDSCHFALQTASMICTANAATKSVRMATIAAAVASVSCIAAWIAAFY